MLLVVYSNELVLSLSQKRIEVRLLTTEHPNLFCIGGDEYRLSVIASCILQIMRISIHCTQIKTEIYIWDAVIGILELDRSLKPVYMLLKVLHFVDNTAVCLYFFLLREKGSFGKTIWPMWPHSANWPEVEHSCPRGVNFPGSLIKLFVNFCV